MRETYSIKVREFDQTNNRPVPAMKTVTRGGATQREVESKLQIEFPRCQIVSIYKLGK